MKQIKIQTNLPCQEKKEKNRKDIVTVKQERERRGRKKITSMRKGVNN